MYIANDYMVDSAYKHVNEYSQEQLLFTSISGNVVFKAIHFSLPVNITNLSLWGDKSKSDAYYFASFLLLGIILSAVIVISSKGGGRYQLFLVLIVTGVSFIFFNEKNASMLLALNCVLYVLSINFLYTGFYRKGLNKILFGFFLWLLPNIYQTMFLEGLYI
jgi:hypothetical protein